MNIITYKNNLLKTAVTLAMCLGTLSAGAHTQPDTPQLPDTIKILAIGNSFSEDALDNHFHDLCREAGKEVIVGNLVIGGCPISKHWNNVRTDAAAYRYRFMDVDGNITYRDNTRFSEVIDTQDWDYVSFQQASSESGIYESYADIDSLVLHVAEKLPTKTRLMWHQTWAYAPQSNHKAFAQYERDQKVMYYAIMAASYRTFARLKQLNVFIPSGTAIENARDMTADRDFTRDGYHLNTTTGRYIAACTWFESIFRTSVEPMQYTPKNLSQEKAALLRKAAHVAVALAPDPR